MADILVTDFVTPDALEMLASSCIVAGDPERLADPRALFDRIRQPQALVVRNRTVVDESLRPPAG